MSEKGALSETPVAEDEKLPTFEEVNARSALFKRWWPWAISMILGALFIVFVTDKVSNEGMFLVMMVLFGVGQFLYSEVNLQLKIMHKKQDLILKKLDEQLSKK